ncbi:MAG: hypothetical protein ACTHK8_19905 [Ginsengibacter sp.]
MKSFTARSLRKEIRSNPAESRKEWLLWIAAPVGNSSFINPYSKQVSVTK